VNQLARIVPRPFAARKFRAFRVTESPARTYPLPIEGRPATLDDALTAVLAGPKLVAHKDRVIIREADELSGAVTVHVYAIRKGKARWVDVGGIATRVEDLKAELVCSFDGEAVL
jgi:hypothetical protein